MPINLIFAAAVFVLAHRFISGSRLRGAIVQRVGERPFRAAFSLLSLLLTAWLVWAYLDAAPVSRDAPSGLLRAIAMTIGAFACYLIVAGLTTRNPTIVGLAETARRPDAVHGVIRLTRHPFLIGIALLAVAHLLVLHALPDGLFFGTLAAVAITGIPSIDAKRARALGQDWETFRRATSIVPGVAVLSGRQRMRLSDIGVLRPALAGVLFVAGTLLHLI